MGYCQLIGGDTQLFTNLPPPKIAYFFGEYIHLSMSSHSSYSSEHIEHINQILVGLQNETDGHLWD